MVIRRSATLVLLGLGVHLILPQVAELQQAAQTVRDMVWWAVGLAALSQVMSYLALANAMQQLVQSPGQHVSLWSALGIVLAGNSIGLIAGGPVATSAAQYRWLRERGVSPTDAAVTGGIIVQINNLMVALASLVSIAHLLTHGQLTVVELAGLVIMGLAIAATAAAFVYGRRHADGLVRGLTRMARRVAGWFHRPFDAQKLDVTVRDVLGVWDRRKEHGWAKPLLAAFLSMFFDMLTLFALFTAARNPVGFGTLLVGYGLPLLLGKLTFLPGGVGIIEASMARLYGSLGVPHEVLVIVVLAYRLVSFWVPNTLGFVLAPVMTHRGQRHRVRASVRPTADTGEHTIDVKTDA